MSDRLLSENEVIKALRKLGHELVVIDKVCSLGVAVEFIDAVRAVPSADRPQGEWECDEYAIYHCSNCGCTATWDYNYCPNCGARMKGVSDETAND